MVAAYVPEHVGEPVHSYAPWIARWPSGKRYWKVPVTFGSLPWAKAAGEMKTKHAAREPKSFLPRLVHPATAPPLFFVLRRGCDRWPIDVNPSAPQFRGELDLLQGVATPT